MKYVGTQESYSPQKIDSLRRNAENSPWPFKFKPYEQKAASVRHPKFKAFKKRFVNRRRKHGRSS